jgi:exodeoxyribonuclease VII small subunit
MATKKTYRTLQAELDTVLEKLQNPEVDIETAVVLFKEGNELIKALQTYLETAKNEIQSIKLS